ncbi:hypothetical protein PILCRDRAFT_62783 [Piloderma croceum F 1598]|uniref:tripeptidyl-peptidase II n=1 Tax=Piloderma croceum (strain F 1598) TaxID=765440 RepID=A0A0C3BP02_PILCF|nr:hypothetical protein PILCRDRAFT_62783 [Piloderma croceum F 1598]
MIWSAVVVFALVQRCVSKPLAKRWDDFAVKHSWTEIPRGWELHGPAPADHSMDMRIGLKQDRLDELISTLYKVSDPAHERYGAHLSAEEVQALVAPHPNTLGLVDSWLTHYDVDPSSIHRSGGKDWITLRVSVAQAERMLGTKYNVYRHSKTSEYVVRTLSYSLPTILTGHVDVVAPTTYFGTMRSMKSTSFKQPNIKPVDSDVNFVVDAVDAKTCSSIVTPSCLRALYKTDSYKPAATDKNSFGITGYLEEYANFADLQTFFKKFRPDAVGGNFTVVELNGGKNDQSNPGTEANLDVQYSLGISYPTPNTYYSTDGSPPFKPDANAPNNTNEPYLDWLNFILNQTTISQTYSTSYGDDEQTVPPDYANSVCNGFAQLGSRGASIMFSSGDSGVGGGACTTNDGKNKTQFLPSFPATCPFVTAVGATTQVNPEVGINFSGGGFSNYFSTPPYQTAATEAFLKSLGTKYSGLYNKTGRGYPDVAAQGQGFQVVIGGQIQSIAGTSASSPTFAAVISLLNDYLISNGKSPLGFLNPFLYSTGSSGLNDITSGSNPGCSTKGFTARAGWDPVTGLGTPDFGKLQALVGK